METGPKLDTLERRLKLLSRVKNLLGFKMTKKAQLVPPSYEGP
jgi:hypothetical protein